jgi:hypothetical protein
MFRSKRKQLDQCSSGQERVHQLVVTRKSERCQQLSVHLREEERTVGDRPIVDGCEPLDCLLVVTARQPQHDLGLHPGRTNHAGAARDEEPGESRQHSFKG